MKKVFIVGLLVMSAFAASAQVAVTGNIGLNSNNIYRGMSVSDDKPSATMGLGLSTKVAAMTVYGDVQASTAVDKAKLDVTVGASAPLGVLTVGGGYRNHSYVNKSFEFVPIKKSDEFFVDASVAVAGGKLSGEYSRNAYPTNYKTDFVRVGYARQAFVPQLTLGVAVTAYNVDKMRLHGYEVTGAYTLAKNLNMNALVGYTRKDAFTDKLSTIGSVGVSYKF